MNKRDKTKDKDKAAVRAGTSYVDADGEARELDAAFFEGAEFGVPDMKPFEKMRRGRPELPEEERKQKVTIMLDRDVVAHFKKDGKGWQTRVNAALREVITSDDNSSSAAHVSVVVAGKTFVAVLPVDGKTEPQFVPVPEAANLARVLNSLREESAKTSRKSALDA